MTAKREIERSPFFSFFGARGSIYFTKCMNSLLYRGVVKGRTGILFCALEPSVYCFRSDFPRSHGQNNGRGTADDVSAGIYALF